MAENIPQSEFNTNDDTANAGNQFSANEIRNRLTAINNYMNANRPGILQGINEAQAEQDRQIGSFKDYLPVVKPTVTKVQNLVSGNIMTGPNPGLKDNIKSYNDYLDALANKSKINIQTARDPYYFARPTSFNSSRFGIQYERYYSHPKFKELGFSIYRDNESLYNERSSGWDDFYRMAKKFPALLGGSMYGTFKNWGKLPGFANAEDAAQMESDLGVATSSRGGAGAWTTNFLANSAYTLGIVTQMYVEQAALNLANVAARGRLTPIVAARGASTLSKMGKSLKIMVDSLKKADKAKSFWTGARGLGSAVLPFQELTKIGRQAFDPNSAFNRLSDYAKVAKTFGAFYRGSRELNLVFSESNLEGGFVANKVSNDALAAFVKENNRMPNPDEALVISAKGTRAGQVASLANVGAIYLSNRFVLDTALKGFKPARRLMSKEGLNSNIFKTIRNYNWKKTGQKYMEVVPRGLVSSGKRIFTTDYLKSIPSRITGVAASKSIGKTFGSGLNYFSANLMEGLQESYQEAVQVAVSDYYLKSYLADLYKDPFLAAKNSSIASAFKGIEEQFSAQGFDVFAQGFLMGGLLGPVQRGVASFGQRAGMKISDIVNKTDTYNEYVANEKKRLQTYADAVNSYTENPALYAQWLDENVKSQRDLSEKAELAEQTGDREAAESARDESLFTHVRTLLNTEKFDGFIEQLEDLNELSDEDLADAFNYNADEEDQDVRTPRERLQTAIKKAKDIQKRTEAINKKFENPYNPDFFKEKDKDAYELEVMGYNAFEKAKQAIAFSEYSYDRAIERISSLVNNAAFNGPLGNVAASDFSALYSSDQGFIQYVSALTSEISALEGGDKEQKKSAKKKQTQLNNLLSLRSDILEFRKTLKEIDEVRLAATDPANATPEAKKKLEDLKQKARGFAEELEIISTKIDPNTGQLSIDFEQENIEFDVILTEYLQDKIYESYAKYTKNIADLKNVFPISKNIENSFGDLMDYIKLDHKARKLADSINMIANPMAIYNMTARIMDAQKEVNKQKKELHLQAVTDFKNNIQDVDDLLNRLFGIGVMFDPDYIEDFRKTGNLPDQFIHAEDGSVILPTDEKYKEIVDVVKELEAERGMTFGNKPVVPEEPVPVDETKKDIISPESPPEQEFEYELEEYDVTTPFNKLPIGIKEMLREEHKKSMDESGVKTDIQDWMRESVIAAAIIGGTYRPPTYKKEEGEIDELKEENLITPKTSKSITVATPATKNIYDQAKEEGWVIDPENESRYINSEKPEEERESVPRVTSLTGKTIEDSNYLRATQGRGNVIDTILRWFSSPSSVQFYVRDIKLPLGISPKDAIINMINLGESKSQILEMLGGEFLGDSGGLVGVFLRTDPVLSKNNIKVEPSVNKDIANILFELAAKTRGFTWHTNVPTMVGTINGKRYGGTIDLLFEKDGKFYIGDIKTSKKPRLLDTRYAESDAIQLNAYADIYEEITGIPIEGLFTINITAEIASDNKTLVNANLVKTKGVDGQEKILSRVDRKPIDEAIKQSKKEEEKSGEAPVSTDVITDDVYNNFIDKNTVPENILNSIADKVINRAPLSQRETSIFTGKTSEINEIIRKKAPVSTDAKADIKIGKIGNTNYEVKADGVYFEGKKLDNPKNKTHRQLIEADIKRRRQEELQKSIGTTAEKNRKKQEQQINAKYDAELDALEVKVESQQKTGRVSLEDQYKNIMNGIKDIPSMLNFIAAYEVNPSMIDATVATVDDVAQMLKDKVKQIDNNPTNISIMNESIDDMVNKLKAEKISETSQEEKLSAQDAIDKAKTVSLEDAQALVGESKSKSQEEIDNEFFNNLNCEG